MQENKIAIHIGLHKTGTSFLQEQVFSNIDSYQLIRGWHSLREIIKNNKDSSFLISDEGISGDFLHGNYQNTFHKNIVLIKKLFGDPKIIVGFRKQEDFILSLYKQYLQQGGFIDFEEFFSFNSEKLIKSDEILFENRIKNIEEMFSEVFIYTQESLIERQNEFLNTISRFLNLDNPIYISNRDRKRKINASIKTKLQVNTLKKLNKINHILSSIPFIPSLYSKFFKKIGFTPRNLCQNYFGGLGKSVYSLSPIVKLAINDYYKEDWDYVQSKISY